MHPEEQLIETRALVRDIMKSCWWILGIYFLGTGIDSFFSLKDKWTFGTETVLLPSAEMAVIIGLMHLAFHKMKKHVEYMLLAGLNGIASTVIIGLYDMPIGIYFLIYPILISLFFYQIRLIRFSCVLGFVTLALIVVLSSKVRTNIQHSDIIMIAAMLTATSFIIHSLMKRALTTAQKLIRTVQEKQELQTMNVLMEKLNRVDPATQLYNHRSFHEYLDSLLEVSSKSPLHIHLALLDIDNFKVINDTFGHRIGDQVISYVAKQIHRHLQPNDFASRYGGEEFAVLCIDKTDEQFYELMEHIRWSIANETKAELEGISVTVSVGIQSYIQGTGKEAFFEGADTALYKAKRTGKNRIVDQRLQSCS